MIESEEKIPALYKLDPIIESINNLITDEVSVEFWVAGGAITSAISGNKINDYDIFSPSPHILIDTLKELGCVNTYENDYFTNFSINGKKIQIIKRYTPKNPEELFNTFDFTINCGAYNGHKFYCHDRFWQDNATKRLVVNNLPFPLKTMERLVKYAKRGYTPCPQGLLSLAKEINSLELDWDNPDENSFEYYPDGSVRFTGPD